MPEVALEYPEALRALHVDYQRAGSDIVEAFTYNGHREKMRVIGKEDLLEPLNRAALQIARKVADAAEAVGRTTEASRFSEKMQNHFMYGDNERLTERIVAP